MNPQEHKEQAQEKAISSRLAAFGKREVDVSALQLRVQAALDAEAEEATRDRRPIPLQIQTHRRRVHPAMALAAMIAIASAIFFAFGLGNPTSALALSALHEDIVAGRIELKPSASIEDANRSIVEQMATSPTLSRDLSNTRIQSCCLINTQGELAAVALLRVDGTPVTLVVVRASEFGLNSGSAITIGGQAFYGHEADHPMVMANHGDRWICVMGDRPEQELAEIASQIDF